MSNDQQTTPDPVPKGYWKDAKGNFVPESRIADVDKARDKLVKRLCEQAQKHSGILAELKILASADIDDFIKACADHYQVKLRGAAGKGNLTLTTYDGKYKVLRAISDTVTFDERLQMAKNVIDQCIHVWAKGANKNLQAIVNQAFDTDKEGKVNVGRVLGLRSLKIDDQEWTKAMTLIADAMRVVSSKSYLRFYERNDETGEYMPIQLDIAGV
jgi:hypothetical protein